MKGSFFFMGGFVSLFKELFSCREFYLRGVLSHNSGGVASFCQAIFDIFGYFSQRWFKRNRSLEAGALLL